MEKESITLCIEDDEVAQINKILLDEIEDIKSASDIDKVEQDTMLGYYQGIYKGLNNYRFEPLSSQELYTIRSLAQKDISFACELLRDKTVSQNLLYPAIPLLKSVVKKIDVYFAQSKIRIISK